VDILLQKLAGSIDAAEAKTVAQRLEDIFSLDNIPPENRAEYCFFLNEWLVSQASGVYWNYTAKDMYLSMKQAILEMPEGFISFSEWKKHFSDFILYLHALMRKERPRYAFIGEALAWIDTHFAEDISMTMAANQVSANYTWFSEKFREQTGMHFNEYLNRLRIGKAKVILESGRYMVYEVAKLSGYQDVEYFQKVFKEISGVSPGEWRTKKL
jgi:two-component system response regulator YesN